MSIDDIISGSGINFNNYYTKGETDIRLAFKQHLLDNTSGSGSTILNSNLIKRLVAGSNVTIAENADGNLGFFLRQQVGQVVEAFQVLLLIFLVQA